MIKKPIFGQAQRGAQTGQVKTLPAPTGGWNTRDNEANMPITKATVLENWFPLASSVAVRPGCLSYATGLPTVGRSLLSYPGLSGTTKLFAACDSGVYDCTSGGVIGAAVVSLTVGYVSHTMFNNISGNYLFMANGSDHMYRYDGSAWTDLESLLTGVSSATLNQLLTFKNRLWAIKKSSMSAWYLPALAIQGAMVEFPIGQIFNKGGYLVAMDSWTIDGGKGMDDHLVFATSEGELAVYKGTDPATAATFELVGVYYLGEPLGNRCFAKFGGDLLYLSQNGLFPLSKALLSTSINYHTALSDEIGPTFAEMSSLYRNNEGWEIFVHPQGSSLFVNIPIALQQRYDQFVMNTVNQAWCRFMGWQATSWAMKDEEAYFTSGTAIYKAFVGTSDNGANIVAKAKQAYTYLGSGAGQKHVQMLRPVLKVDGTPSIELGVSADFDTTEVWTYPTPGSISSGVWDTSIWDAALWGADLVTVKNWYTVPSKEGYALAALLRITTNASKVIWNATDVLFQKGGVL